MKKKIITVKVVEQIGQIMASVTHDGEKLCVIISQALDEKKNITLDFSEIDLVTSSFLNASIGQLYNKYESAYLEKHLKIENLNPTGMITLKRVQEWAQNYFKNNKAV